MMDKRLLYCLLAAALSCRAAESVAQMERRPGNVAVGVNRHTADSMLVSHANVGLLTCVDTLRGVQLSATAATVWRDMCGANLAVLASVGHGRAYGLQAAGVAGASSGTMHGMQLAGVSNVAHRFSGLQIAGLTNAATSPMRGVQLSTVANISMGVERGAQLSAVSNVCSSYMRGLQAAAYNYADTLNGSQIGLINVCVSHPRGVQIGLVNYSRDTVAHKVGLVNLNPSTRIDLMAGAGTSTKFNAALRFRNRSTYNIIGFGTHYMGLDERFSGAVFYRIGQYFALTPRLSVGGDIGFYHVETFREHSADKPERLYSIQGRLNLDYQLNRNLGAFVSVGYGDTRYYSNSHRYRNRAILEGGLSFRLPSVRPGAEGRRLPDNLTLPDTDELMPPSLAAVRKKPWLAAAEVVGINAFVQLFDRFVLDADYAQINLHTIHRNLKTGFVWDNDQFSTNLFAHPYHGGLYFNAARSNGMNFWESVPYALGGSLMWETTCEIEPPAINDLMATTLGGVAIGEVTHRISDLVYDDTKRGWPRFFRELLGTVVCPIRGLNRIISGEAWRVTSASGLGNGRYHDHDRLPVTLDVGVGARYLADNAALFRGESTPYVSLNLVYGDPFDEESNAPYDFFTANVVFGLGSNQPLVSDVHLVGQLWTTPVYSSNGMQAEFGFFQHFNYYDSQPVKDGSSQVPFRISEAASLGAGIIYRFPRVGNLVALEQRIFVNAMLLGGSLSDYYNVIDRDYNMGSGYSAKVYTTMDFGRFGRFAVNADLYQMYTWKGYEGKDLRNTNPIYLNAQGDRGSARLFVLTPSLHLSLTEKLSLDLSASYYIRETHYKYHDDVHARTFTASAGVGMVF